MKIYGQEWKVVYTTHDDIAKICGDIEHKELWGMCSGIDNTIYLNNAMSKERTRKTLIHEIAHAIQEESGLKPFMNKTDEERTVEFMAAHYDEVSRILKEVEKYEN
jgi:Zn-dependent peptidase ImmA (M78 family)